MHLQIFSSQVRALLSSDELEVPVSLMVKSTGEEDRERRQFSSCDACGEDQPATDRAAFQT